MRLRPRIRIAAAGCVVISLVVLRLLAPATVSACGLSEYEDDYFRPWYMAKDYCVTELLPELEKHPEIPAVFQSFNSDPCPLIFYAALFEIDRDFRPDVPIGSVKSMPPSALFFLRKDEDPADFETRFRGRLFRLFTGHDCIVYQFVGGGAGE